MSYKHIIVTQFATFCHILSYFFFIKAKLACKTFLSIDFNILDLYYFTNTHSVLKIILQFFELINCLL